MCLPCLQIKIVETFCVLSTEHRGESVLSSEARYLPSQHYRFFSLSLPLCAFVFYDAHFIHTSVFSFHLPVFFLFSVLHFTFRGQSQSFRCLLLLLLPLQLKSWKKEFPQYVLKSGSEFKSLSASFFFVVSLSFSCRSLLLFYCGNHEHSIGARRAVD